MKRFLTVGLAVLFIVAGIGAAWAAMNLRQRSDGGADWENSRGTTFRVGQQFLNFPALTLDSAATFKVPVGFGGILTRVYCTMSDITVITANTEIGVSVQDLQRGKVGTVTFMSTHARVRNDARTAVLSSRITEGSYITLTNAGTGGAAATAWCTAVVAPDPTQ